jgi:hypothetical protein
MSTPPVVDLERGDTEAVPPNEQTPLLPTAANESPNASSNAPEAIPASSVQGSAMNGFAGLGCT